MLDRNEARRLHNDLVATLGKLDWQLLIANDGAQFGADVDRARQEVSPLVCDVTDLLRALVNLDQVAEGVRADSEAAIQRADQNIDETVEVMNGEHVEAWSEEFRVTLEFTRLAERLRRIYGLYANPEDYIFANRAQKLLHRMCGQIGATVEHLVAKGIVTLPTREDHVKHILYATCRAAFSDALPDGKIVFEGLLRGYKPDLGVPGLKTCVELKLARDLKELASVLDQIVVDQGNYGSLDYTTFISLIYATSNEITPAIVQAAIQEKMETLGANPRFAWTALVTQGVLAPRS